MPAQSECGYFHNSAIVPTYLYRIMLITLKKNRTSLQDRCKSILQNQSSALPG